MDDNKLDLVGTDEALVLDMVCQSIILAKNNGDLLLLDTSSFSAGRVADGYNNKERLHILVTGPTSNVGIYPTDGWTSDWQGVSAADEDKWFAYGSSLLEAFMAQKSWDVSFHCGVDILGQSCDEVDD